MFRLIVLWIVNAAALLLVAYFVPGITVASFYTALGVALIFGVINVFIKPFIKILTLPITVITLGLFTLVINGALFWFVASWVDGFSVNGFGTAVLGALVFSVLTYISGHLLKHHQS